MPTEADFLAAVLADPDDDAPRLIMADWLEEQGQRDRAEFIKVQIAIEPLRDNGGRHAERFENDKRWYALRRREGELLNLLYRELDFGIPPGSPVLRVEQDVLHVGGVEYRFRRGFVHAVTCTAEDWLAHGDAILVAQPVRKVSLTTWPNVESRVNHRSSPQYRLPGRKWRSRGRSLEFATAPGDVLSGLLRAEWPGIEFTLPPADHFTTGQRLRTHADGSPWQLTDWREARLSPAFGVPPRPNDGRHESPP